ncbi:MAG: metal-dependent transcriptional regulator [Candidatus Dormibacteria bacterium]
MPAKHPQPALQDYLKAVYRVTESRGGEPANTKAIAAELGVSQPSVSAMLDRMAADGLVDYVHYAGATLSRRGRRAALRVIRRHRLLELYLERFLGLGWDEVHEEAELLEHALSARVEAAIDAALGQPAFDPHGDPIPSVDGAVRRADWRSLWDSQVAGRARIARVSDADPGLLRHLRRMGIVPGATVSAIRRESGGALRLRIGRREEMLGREAAEKVFVTVV